MTFLPLDYAIRNLYRSPLRWFAIVLSCTLVVLLIQAASAFIQGMQQTLHFDSPEENVIFLSAGSEESLERSEIKRNTASIIAASVAGLKSTWGRLWVSEEIHGAFIVQQSENHPKEFRALFRGITPEAFLVHSRVEILEGRAPQAGQDEILIGRLVSEKLGMDMKSLAIGSALWFSGRPWTIVGHFQAPSSVMEAEIWIPLTDLQIAIKRDGVSAVFVTLEEAEFEDMDLFTKQRVDLELVVLREKEYYASLLRFYRPVHWMIWVTSLLVSLAGLLCGLNVMYAAFSSRMREIGMLLSLGFSRFSILVSFIQESVFSTTIGALLASVLSIAFLDGVAVKFSMGVFQLNLNLYTLLLGLGLEWLWELWGLFPLLGVA